MRTLDAVQTRLFGAVLPWREINAELARSQPDVLDLVREACLIESYFTVYTAKMLELFWYDVDATAAFTIEAYEAYGHYALLRRYLDTVGYRPVTDEEVVALRERDRGVLHDDEVEELVNFMATEHFAAAFFRDLSELAREPVLKALLRRLGAEEVAHSRFAAELLERRIERDPALGRRVLECARSFRHVGAYVLPSVSPASEDNLPAILSFNRRIEELVGHRLSDALVSMRGESS